MIFNNIGVITNERKDPEFKYTNDLINYLSGKKNINIHKRNINHDIEDLYKLCDLFIVLGGDGTILKVAPGASRYDIPVIGVNLGRIGYMNEIESDEIELLGNLFDGDYKIKNRMMLDAEIIKENGETVQAGSALNDAVISHGVFAKLIETGVKCDGIWITDYRADGIIIATPTGSTAYSMSAGGPIIDPDIECFCVTPICPHSLVNRPLIFSHGSVLEITNKNIGADIYLALDGQINIKLDEKDIVKIKKSEFTAKFIAIKKHGFFNVVRGKINYEI